MRSVIRLLTLSVAICFGSEAMMAQVSPYAGQQTREIKSLSAQDVDDLLNACGIALAKAGNCSGVRICAKSMS
jgi:hypothetical protein